MTTVKEKLAQHGVSLNNGRIEIGTVQKQINSKELEIEKLQRDCIRLNKYYWGVVIPKLRSVANPPNSWKQKADQIYSELKERRKRLEELKNGDKE